MIPTRLLFFTFAFFISLSSFAQDQPTAQVQVTVTNSKHQPLKAQEIVFSNAEHTMQIQSKTDAAGRCMARLPAGATYSIRLRTLTDTLDYSNLDIPALKTGQFFKAPFTVDIEYEPARTFTLNHVYFDTNLPTLRPDSFKELNEIAEYMSLKGDDRYEISGHTDNTGKDEDNLKLSQKRAESVKAYLVKKGIKPARLDAKGYGAAHPIDDNSTPEGRQKNRRTEVVIL